MPPTRKPIARTALLLVPFQVVRAGEAALPVLLARWFGFTRAADIYYFALAYFGFVASVSFGIFRDSVLVPVLAEVRVRDPKALPEVAGAFLTHTLVWGGALAAAVGAAALACFRLRYDGADFALAASMVIPFALYLVALAVKTFFLAALAAHHQFFAQPITAGLGVAATLLTVALLRGPMGIAAVPAASLMGELTGIAIAAWMAIRLMKLRFPLSMARPEPVRRFVGLALPDVAGGAITRVNPVVDQAMSGTTGVVGGGALLKQAGDLADFPTSILQAALLPVLLTHLADDFAEQKRDRFRATVVRSLFISTGALAAVALALFLVREPLLRLVFQHGAVTREGTDRLIALLPYHLLGLPAFGALLVLARAHVALQNTKLMLPVGIFNAALHLVLNVALVRPLGLAGLALSTSMVNVAVAAVFWVRLEARLAAAA